MEEIKFSAVDIGDIWGHIWNVLNQRDSWEYGIWGVYEEDNQKFAVLRDRDQNFYRLDFSLTEDGFVVADTVVEVKQEFIETDNIKKFAEPENVADYRLAEKEETAETEPEEETEEGDSEKEMSTDEMMAKITELEKAIEERDNIIMEKETELEGLRAFKADIDEKEKAKTVEGVMAEVKDFLDDESVKSFREEGMLCKLSDIDGWANKVKAASFEATKSKKPKKENFGIWGFAAPKSAPKQRNNSVWDRI